MWMHGIYHKSSSVCPFFFSYIRTLAPTQVVVRVNGDVEQLEVDMSPRYDAVGTILGGKATFIGEYEKLQVCERIVGHV
jgi:hypothetical protein